MRVRIARGKRIYEGILMPGLTDHLVIKLDNGYNIGLKRDKVEILASWEEKGVNRLPDEKPGYDPSLPDLVILSTGGTIACRVDYRTGAVTSQFTADEILKAIPELKEIANFEAEVVYNILSENMRASYWIELARKTFDKIKKGADGIVITHGTDTLGFTAAALAFMVRTPVPIVLVGSQRSADRPSSDNTMNACCAAKVATSDIAEVVCVMHGSTSDDFCLIHRGVKVRKMHTSRRDAFRSINANPIGRVSYPDLRIEISGPHLKPGDVEPALYDGLEQRCALVKYYPGADPEILDFYREKGYRGIVIEGTGLGHTSKLWFDPIKRLVDEGVVVVMTSQCLYGRVCDRVYDTGRDLLKLGVIEGEDMLPEVALIKLMWVLNREDDPEKVSQLMKTNLVGEITDSTDIFGGF
ncbi:MAG TPA: Glu-tRNA(Gln) amidotransferase subunit GatD [Candidatus Syntrophoarchaeum butanivorans]|uniref:Glutamyl-tRNA(Gln) amidotransferase subunit D n=1 Tax=Candidatus Syntropharchaeum butanivorans TaxID=1839936 RepID=A0A7C1B690_9EURY|nr:Glu-tRNA(Gln) amidotransferase subunit GatD [Candidatus Syntrophoarchaeum butanivorans]